MRAKDLSSPGPFPKCLQKLELDHAQLDQEPSLSHWQQGPRHFHHLLLSPRVHTNRKLNPQGREESDLGTFPSNSSNHQAIMPIP